jgi:hypothetical protein
MDDFFEGLLAALGAALSGAQNPQVEAWLQMYPRQTFFRNTDEVCLDPECPGCGGDGSSPIVEPYVIDSALN